MIQRWPRWFLLVSVVAVAACSSSGTTTGPSPAIAVAIAPASGSAAQGGTTQVTATVTASGGFSGAVTVAVTGAPNGVTETVTGTQSSGDVTTVLVTLSVASTVAAGPYQVTVRAQGNGVSDATANYALTVTAAPSFSLSVTPATLNIGQGYTAFSAITVTRGSGFTGSVAFTVTGAPTGLTLSPAPTATTGASASFGLLAASSVAPGSYPLTVHGTASGLPEQTATLSVVVTAAGTGNVAMDFSGCSAASKPIWIATQDGSGPWTRATGTADVYRFNSNAATAQVAWVTSSGSNAYTVHQLTRLHDALVAAPQVVCGASGTKAINGSLLNLAAGATGQVNLGGGQVARTVNGAFQLTGVADGSQDLTAYARSAVSPGTADRALIRRAQNLASGGALAAVDFAGAESFAPVPATVSVSGALAGETFGYSMEYLTGAGAGGCQLGILYSDVPSSPTSFSAYGIPAAQQAATDFHGLAFSATESTGNAVRTVVQYFHGMGALNMSLPAVLPVPSFANLGGPYRRLQATFVMPTDYAATAVLQYADPTGPTRFVTMTADGGALAALGGVMALADFTAVPGWDSGWGPQATTSSWSLLGVSAPVSSCSEGARSVFSQRFGSF